MRESTRQPLVDLTVTLRETVGQTRIDHTQILDNAAPFAMVFQRTLAQRNDL